MILLPDHHSICSLTHQILTIQQFILCCPEQSYYTPQFICSPCRQEQKMLLTGFRLKEWEERLL